LKKGHNPYYKTRAFIEALDFASDIAIIHLGLNDTDPRNWPAYKDEFASDYSWLIDTLRKSNPRIRIYISKLSPIFPDHKRFLSGTRDWFWQIQQLIPTIAAANNVGLLDFHTPLYSRPDLFPDPLHPNEEGAALIAQTVYQKISGNYGGLKLPFVFASNMVFQRNQSIPFYGIANAGDTVKVQFNNLIKMAIPDEDGKWNLQFPSLNAGGPYNATISTSSKKIVFSNIFIGEVWLCAGQSNMDFPLHASINSSDEMLKAQNSSRLFLLNREPV
ncbi:MAG: GDSL-type esterase/lipase family protein, partial [Flavitalea sp.]